MTDGKSVKAGNNLANWDPHHRPIVSEYAGTVKFENVEEGTTVAKQIDDVTGLSTLVAIDPKRRGSAAAKGARPSVKIINEQGDEVKIAATDHAVNIGFPVGAVIAVRDGHGVPQGPQGPGRRATDAGPAARRSRGSGCGSNCGWHVAGSSSLQDKGRREAPFFFGRLLRRIRLLGVATISAVAHRPGYHCV